MLDLIPNFVFFSPLLSLWLFCSTFRETSVTLSEKCLAEVLYFYGTISKFKMSYFLSVPVFSKPALVLCVLYGISRLFRQ